LLTTTYSDDPSNATLFSTFAGADDAVVVPGLGDQAVVRADSLYLLADQAMVVLQVGPSGLSQLDPQHLIDLGRIIAGRL
jgi:hypothetical protein